MKVCGSGAVLSLSLADMEQLHKFASHVTHLTQFARLGLIFWSTHPLPHTPSLERNKRWCNKRGCKSNKYGNMQIWPNLRNNWPDLRKNRAKFAQLCATLRNCFCKIYANLREIYGPVCYGTVCSYLIIFLEPGLALPQVLPTCMKPMHGLRQANSSRVVRLFI